MPAETSSVRVPAYADLLQIALPGRLGRIYAFSFLALHVTISTLITVPLSPRTWPWLCLRLLWPPLIACSAAAFALGLLPLLIADRRATSHFASARMSSKGSIASITLLLLRIVYALVFSIAHATALAWANEATSPTYRDSWAPYIPSYFGRAAASSGTMTASSRKHGSYPGASAHAQTRPNERYIFLVISAVLTSTLVPILFARTSVQGNARRPGDSAALLFHPLELHSPLTTRLRAAAFPRLIAPTSAAEPGKEPAQLFLAHTLAALLLPLIAYLPIYTLIRRHLYRSILLLIIRLTAGDTRTAAQTLSGSVRHSTIALSAAAKLRYFLIPSLRGGVFSFLFNIELLLRPALLSAAIFAVAELSLSLGRVYASQPVLVSGYANPQLTAPPGSTANAQPSKDLYTAPTRCLVDGIVDSSAKILKAPSARSKDLYVLHLAVAELAMVASAPDGSRRRALFNDFGNASASSRLSLGADSFGSYGAALQPDRESAWAQVTKAGIKLLQAESTLVRDRIAPSKAPATVTAKADSAEASQLSKPNFGRDAFVPFVPPPGDKGGQAQPSGPKAPATKSVWDRLAEEVAASGSGPRSASTPARPQPDGPQTTATSALIVPPAAPAKAKGVLSSAMAVGSSVLRLFSPPAPARPTPASGTQNSSTELQRRADAVPPPVTPLEAGQALVEALQQNGQGVLRWLDQLVPKSRRDAVVKRVHEAVPAAASVTAHDGSSATTAFLQLLLPVSPRALSKYSPLIRTELEAVSTAASLSRVLPAHPALAVWIAQALTELAAASLTEDEYGCVQRASRASARLARSQRREGAGAAAGAAAAASEAGAGVSDVMEAMLALWEAVDAAVQHERRRLGQDESQGLALWEMSVQDVVLLPLRRSIGELWASFSRFGAEVGFGEGEEEAGRWRKRVEIVLRAGDVN
ncbi:hypothetical protein OC835_004749 [Tilletia horrida]|nr:hypothetical protein OC835_004749 [Tilletia horrida]